MESNNHSINQHMPKDYLSYIITTGGCSCDLFSEEIEAGAKVKKDVAAVLVLAWHP